MTQTDVRITMYISDTYSLHYQLPYTYPAEPWPLFNYIVLIKQIKFPDK